MNKIAGTIIGLAMVGIGGMAPIVPQVGFGTTPVAIFQNKDGSYTLQNISNEQYDLMGTVNGYQHNPTLEGATLVETAEIQAASGIATLEAWDTNGKQIVTQDVQGKEVLPTFPNDDVTFTSVAGLLSAQPAHAAIAFDQASAGTRVSAASITWSCAFTGSNLVAIIEVGNNDASNADVSTATVNGVSATKIDRAQLTSGGQGNMFVGYVAAPTNGNCIGTSSTGSHIMDGHVSSYTGVDQTTPIDVSMQNATTSSNGSSFSQTTTPCAANSWLVWSVQNDAGLPLDSTNMTSRSTSVAGAMSLGDSNGPFSSATTQTVTFAVATNWDGIQLAIRVSGGTCGGGGSSSAQPQDQWFMVL